MLRHTATEAELRSIGFNTQTDFGLSCADKSTLLPRPSWLAADFREQVLGNFLALRRDDAAPLLRAALSDN